MKHIPADDPIWSTAVPDWETRIMDGTSLVPFDPIFPDEAERALAIFKSLKLVDVAPIEDPETGEMRPPTFGEAADDWVFDFVRAIFGGYDPEKTTKRRIREYLLLIAKKNGKSTIAAGIMLTALIRNWRHSGQYLILAPTIEVADNSFGPAADMIAADDELNTIFHVQPNRRMITHRVTKATLKVVAANSETVSGKKAIGVLIDELWLFGKRADAAKMLGEATGGQTSRPEGFVIYVSTHSDEEPAGVFKAKLRQFRDIRDGKIVDPSRFGVLYEFPKAMLKSKAYLKEENWFITNPNIDRSVDRDWMRSQLEEKQRGKPGELAEFLAKFLNVEIGQEIRVDNWSGAEFWEKAGLAEVDLEYILGVCEAVVVGIDGGGLDDLLSLGVMGREMETGRWLFWQKSWAHKVVLERRKSEVSKLQDFADSGDLTICELAGDDVDEVANIVERIEESGLLAEEHAVGVDAIGIGQIVQAIVKKGISRDRIVAIPQGYGLNGAIETAARKLVDGTLIHAAQPIMRWAVGNAKAEPVGNAIRITKQISGRTKIDPVMALFNCTALMIRDPQSAGGRSVFDDMADAIPRLNERQAKLIGYLRDAGPDVRIDHFDGDHMPVGPQLRADLVRSQLAHELAGMIIPTETALQALVLRETPPEGVQSDGIDYSILGNPKHPLFFQMRDRYERQLHRGRDEDD